MFLSSYGITSGRLGEREMLWELNTSHRQVYRKMFWFLPNFHECFYNSIETRSTRFLILLENTATSKGDFCLRMRKKVKRVFCFTTFVHALRERAVFGAAEFDNRTFEGESLHVTVKSNSRWRENCAFISLTAILRAIKLFSCAPVIVKDGDFKDNKDEAKQTLTHFCSTPKSTTGRIRRQPKGKWLLW